MNRSGGAATQRLPGRGFGVCGVGALLEEPSRPRRPPTCPRRCERCWMRKPIGSRHPRPPRTAQARWYAIRQINEALQPWVDDCRHRLLELQAETAHVVRAEKNSHLAGVRLLSLSERALREFYEGATSQII